MGHYHDVQNEIHPDYTRLRQLIPDVMSSYASVHRGAMQGGALDEKTKELIALAVAITRQCDGCIAAHAKGCVRRGASEEEVAEMIGVTILLNGGPGTVYGPRALAAFNEFHAEDSSQR